MFCFSMEGNKYIRINEITRETLEMSSHPTFVSKVTNLKVSNYS